MELHQRYPEDEDVQTELNPMEDAIDWLAGLQSQSRMVELLKKTRGIGTDEAAKRAKRVKDFAGIALDFIEAARSGKPHVAFLPAYYAYLNLAKVMLACSEASAEVEGGIGHGVSYNPSQKESQSLFTERLKIHRAGVFPLLYKIMAGKEIPIRRRKKGREYREITLDEVYARSYSVGKEYVDCQGQEASRIGGIGKVRYQTTATPCERWVVANVGTVFGEPLPDNERIPLLPKWKCVAAGSLEWRSPSQPDTPGTVFDVNKVLKRNYFYLPAIHGISGEKYGVFARSLGRMSFTEEIPIFLALFHLSSIVRYKPRFLDVVRDSAAYPLILAARRHLLYRGLILTLSYVLHKNIIFRGI